LDEEDRIAEEELTPEEANLLRSMSSPQAEEKHSVFTFFNRILQTKDTLKVSNLKENELNSVRILRNAANYADLVGLDIVASYINGKSETLLGSSLSREGFLIRQSITQKKEVKSDSRMRRMKKNWYGKPTGEMEEE